MTLPPIMHRARRFDLRVALIDPDGTTHTYRTLLERSANIASALLQEETDLTEQRVAFLVSPGSPYVIAQWGIWRAGGIAVPLASMHPVPELEFVLKDCEATAVVVDNTTRERIAPLARKLQRRLVILDAVDTTAARETPHVDTSRRAMIVYTSGSTGKPKGVVTSHANIAAQIESLVSAWEWSPEDRILLTLPLHHVHGIINVVACCLWSGATCITHDGFDPERVWTSFGHDHLTIFMAVPTIYRKLIEHWHARSRSGNGKLSVADTMRLMVSGSAALPVHTLAEWSELTGHTLLERYGMTEIGMALSNPLHGERVPAHVGFPLPGVEIRLVGDDNTVVPEGDAGEIHVRGDGVFKEYWNRSDETAAAFDGSWFRTGDVAVLHDKGYQILGRQSVDIIKTAGYKVSALEIEDVLRRHPSISECAIVGIPDETFGERVSVAAELTEQLTIEALQSWAREHLAPYKVPRVLLAVQNLPRNALGKIIKPQVVQLFETRK